MSSRFDGVGYEISNKINLLSGKRDDSSKAVVQILLAASCGDKVALQRLEMSHLKGAKLGDVRCILH